MSLELRGDPPWLDTVPVAEDDTEESVMGSDLHQTAIYECHATLLEYAESAAAGRYVSSQVTVIATLPGQANPWQPKPDLFVVPGVPAHSRTSYDTRAEGPMPPFVLEVASESTWRRDVREKAGWYQLAGVREYLVFDPAAAFLREQVRAWRLGTGGWGRWQPVARADGTRVWESAVLGLGLRPEGLLLRFEHPARGVLPTRRDLRERLAQSQVAERAAEERAAQAQRDLEAALAELARLRAQRQEP